MQNSIVLNVDSYKVLMSKMYPPNTTGVYSYIESRGGEFDKVLFFGLQMFLKEYLCKPITKEDIDEAEEVWNAHFGSKCFIRENWEYILKEHNGYLPLRIKAVPEGTVIPVKNVLATVENTDQKCFWLTTWVETALLRSVWYPTTVATLSKNIKNVIKNYLEVTGDESGLAYKCHDFGNRGVSSYESSGIGAAAHLVNFMGTDTISGVMFARKYYGEPMAGYSIPASEHSVITAWGKENEIDAYRNMINQFGGSGKIFACVSDSYDIFNAVEHIWGEQLRQEVIDSGATVVIRPDSGDPEIIIHTLLDILGNKFGYQYNSKGYKVLNNVRLIQGDGVNYHKIEAILAMMRIHGWSADNIAFGMGGALLQAPQRDDQKFAMKASAILKSSNADWIPIAKDPITDSGKKSKKGRVTTYRDVNGNYFSDVENGDESVLHTVYENGKLFNELTFSEVRNNSNS